MAEYNDGVLTLRESDKSVSRKVFLMSDVHFDSVFCNRDLLKKHLDAALQENAWIVLGGDWFDAMQGRFDPRRSMDELRQEYRRDDYYDFVVSDSASFLASYAKQIVMICRGNHELAVLKNANTDLTDRLVYALAAHGGQAVAGGWKGWIRFILSASEHNGSVFLYFAHSAGDGSAPVTRGVIATNRQSVYLPDADIIWNAHNHHAYIVPLARERLTRKGVRYTDIAWHVRSPGYKREWDSDSGFAAQRGFGPRPLGCAEVTIKHNPHGRPSVTANLLMEA